MKIKVKDLKANPYRKIDHYPIRRERVESLKGSIEQTSFWDNILARATGNGHYEIAYGHHRLVALQELGIEEVDIPVKDIDEATMLKIMANENMGDWDTLPAVIDETVITTKEFLDKNISKSLSLKDLEGRMPIYRGLIGNEGTFKQLKNSGVGKGVIQRFLGNNWTTTSIERALSVYHADQEGILDREAAEMFEKQAHTEAFVTEVKQREIPKEEQKRIAKEIIEDNTDEGGEVDMKSFDVRYHFMRKDDLFEDHSPPDIDDVVDDLIKNLHQVNSNIHFVFEHKEWITPSKLVKVNALILRLFEIIQANKPEEEEHNLIEERR